MIMTRTTLRHLAVVAVLLAGSIAAAAQTVRTADMRTILRPNPKASELAQVSGYLRTFDLQHDAAQDVFGAAPARLTLTNVELPGKPDATVELRKTRAVYDATTKFYTMTKQGKREFKVRPITSYVGVIKGVEGSRVSLHYSDGDLTGVIEDASGYRVVVSQDMDGKARATSTPHLLADEQAAYGGNIMSKFLCGNEGIAEDQVKLARDMHARPAKPMYMLQDDDMRELKLAVVLREDVDSVMKRRGNTDEQIAQYFAKIIACVNQAYEQEFNTTIYVPYFLKFTEDEPSPYFSNGREPGNLLEEFSQDWSSNYSDVTRDAAHLFALIRPAGGSYVGGIAYRGTLCDRAFRGGYAVSTVWTNQEFPARPTVANAFVWDHFVIAHELGHNVGSPHTHNCFWTPKPVDTCQLKEDNTDACYSSTQLGRVVRPGTIMSYCHLVNGSTTPFLFGDRVSEKMRGWVEQSCLQRPAQPTLNITYPRGSEDWNAGSVIGIKWASYRVSKIRFEYSTNEGSNWEQIATNVNAVDRTYNWTLPTITASRVWIRAVDVDGSGAADTTLATYAITSPLSITDPKGGERIGQGTSYVVKWVRQPSVPSVNLLFAANGTDFEEIATGLTATTYTWTVPTIVTEEARMRVVSSSNPAIQSTGAPFAIGVPRFELVLPKPGETVCSNQPNQYRWDGDFIDRIRIQYSTDGGTQWRTATQQTAIEVADWQIFSRAGSLGSIPENTPCIVRVLDNATSEELDRVENLVIKACDQPVSVQEQDVQPTDLRIVGVTPNPASSEAMLTFDAARPMTVHVDLVSMDGTSTTVVANLAVEAGAARQIMVPLGTVANGAYQLALRAGTMRVAVPITIVR